MDYKVDLRLGARRLRFASFAVILAIAAALWFALFGKGFILVLLLSSAVICLLVLSLDLYVVAGLLEPIWFLYGHGRHPFWKLFFAAASWADLQDRSREAMQIVRELWHLARGTKFDGRRNLIALLRKEDLTRARLTLAEERITQDRLEHRLVTNGVDVGLRLGDIVNMIREKGYDYAKGKVEARELEYYTWLFTEAERFGCTEEVRQALDARRVVTAEAIVQKKAREAQGTHVRFVPA